MANPSSAAAAAAAAKRPAIRRVAGGIDVGALAWHDAARVAPINP